MRLLLADDDILVTTGIQTILEKSTLDSDDPCEIVAVASNGTEAIDHYFNYSPDIVLMDIRMPIMNGIEASQQILEKDPHARILFLTTFQEDDYITQALNIGAKGYILKTDYPSLVSSLTAVMNGQRVFGDQIIDRLSDLYQTTDHLKTSVVEASLNEKENELIYWVAKGLNNKEIAEKMHFSEGTIRNYLSVILEKLQLRDRTQLAIFYFQTFER